MRQVVDPVEHDVLTIILIQGSCHISDIARYFSATFITKIPAILDTWIKEGVIENTMDIYSVLPEKKLILKNELMRYEATLPPTAYSLCNISPAAAESLSHWEDMVKVFESGGIPEKDRKLYFQGISIVASGLMRKLEWTFHEVVATAEFVEQLMADVQTKMDNLTTNIKTENTK